MAPGISVVIPTFNRSAMVLRAIRSVLDSDEAAFELVVVDDGSTDGTYALVHGLNDRRVRYVRLPEHRNGNVARNRGVAASIAPLVGFLDSDDEVAPTRLSRLLRLFDRLPEVDASLDDFWVEKFGRRELARQPRILAGGAELIRLLVSHAIPLTTSAICVRRKALHAIGGFDEALPRHQDRDLLLRLGGQGKVILGTAADVTKHQSLDSFPRWAAGYIEALDMLVQRHSIFLAAENSSLISYLIARSIVRAVLAGRIVHAAREARSLSRAVALPHGLREALSGYRAGRAVRKDLEAAASRGKQFPDEVASVG